MLSYWLLILNNKIIVLRLFHSHISCSCLADVPDTEPEAGSRWCPTMFPAQSHSSGYTPGVRYTHMYLTCRVKKGCIVWKCGALWHIRRHDNCSSSGHTSSHSSRHQTDRKIFHRLLNADTVSVVSCFFITEFHSVSQLQQDLTSQYIVQPFREEMIWFMIYTLGESDVVKHHFEAYTV